MPRMLQRKFMVSVPPAGIGASLRESAYSRSGLASDKAQGIALRDSFFQAAGFRLGDDGQWTAAKEGLEDEEPADEPVGRASKEGQWFTDDSFPEVPYEELDERKREVVMAQPWRRAGESFVTRPVRCYAGLNVLYPRKEM